MKRFLFLALLVLGVATWSAEAAVRTGVQKARGGIISSDGSVSGSAETITGVAITCGGTACGASLYDLADNDATAPADANGVFENSAAANGTTYVNLDPPIRTTSGIYAHLDVNVAGLIVFTEQATP